MIDWIESRGVKTHIEDRGRIILHSGKAQELLTLLESELKKNNTETRLHFAVEDIEKIDGVFVIKRKESDEVVRAKNVIISSGGKSFAQVGTDGWGFRLAQKYGIEVIEPYK